MKIVVSHCGKCQTILDFGNNMNFMRNTVFVLSLVSAILLPSSKVISADRLAIWIGGTGNWSDATNWDTNPLFPDNGNGGLTYDVTFGFDSSDVVTVGRDITIESLFFRGGTINGAFDLTLNNESTWMSNRLISTMTGRGVTTISKGASLEIVSPENGRLLLDGRTIDNLGRVTLSQARRFSADFVGTSRAVFNNAGLLEIFDDMNLVVNRGFGSGSERGATLNNSGTLVKARGDAGSLLDWELHNTGEINVQSGDFFLTGGASSTGMFNISPGSTLHFDGPPSSDADYDLTGSMARPIKNVPFNIDEV